ncbi:hypothetical protein DL95DRAFT_391157 [Leptodontidium sp. 2 PMI_412]|nr:hypothetical protein DL95DRAFT_391157 [Leptodontidium sp. 2 PMI_412]
MCVVYKVAICYPPLPMAQSFTLFNTLPTELRLLIWQHCLEPRIIPLQCQIQCCLNTPGTFLYHSFLQPTSDRSRSRELPPAVVDIRVHFAAASTISPAAILQICRESRQFAIKAGYRVWKLRNEYGHTRDVMWNAAVDTVSLATPHRASIPRFYGELFKRQFPVEVKRVQTIAVPISSWKEKNREKPEVGECWAGYSKLERIVVVLADAIQRKGGGAVEHGTCELIGGMKGRLEKIAAGCGVQWNVPSVVLVGAERDVLRVEDLEMQVACDPCPSIEGRGCKVVLVHTKCSG